VHRSVCSQTQERLAQLKAKGKGTSNQQNKDQTANQATGNKRKAQNDAELALAVPTVEETVQELKEEALQEREIEVDLQNLAPKKLDWDLEREVEAKLQKLERRTTITIAQIIRSCL